MNERLQRLSGHLYFTGLMLLVAGMPVSLFLTSLSQFFLAGSFLAGNVGEKFKRFFNNKYALLIAGIWLFHVLGLLWTTDIQEGLKDVRIKLPLLILPLIIAGNPSLSQKKIRWVLITFVFAIFCGTMVSMAVLKGIIHRNIYDIRDVFIFNISHIRFALFTCLGIFILIYYAFFDKSIRVTSGMKFLAITMIFWLIAFLFIVVSMTGLLIFTITGLVLLLFYAWQHSNKKLRLFLIIILIGVPVASTLFLKSYVRSANKTHVVVQEPGMKTKLGNLYDIPQVDTFYENGYPVWIFACEMELRETWNSISEFKYDSLDERKQPIRATLVRFMASKGMRKDAEGVGMLTAEERRAIERGVANVNYQKLSSMRSRMQQIIWEVDQYLQFGTQSGHSVTQRLEFWHAGWLIAEENILTGVGTGDMPQAYRVQYEKMNTQLDERHRLRAHNQFLALVVALGIFGLIYFLIAMFYPILSPRIKLNMLFGAFFLIVFLSMFSEDTLETQAGATFFAFFFVFLLGKGE